ncbi:MAG: SDR family oxidoreductase [Gemmataceae bacterium]
MRRDLRGARILLTGASSGIGQRLAEQAAHAGAKLALMARSADALHELAHSLTALGADAIAVPGDVTREADRRNVLATVVERFGGLDVLINNAGVGSWCHFAESSEEILRRIMEVNFFGPAELIRLAIPVLRKGRSPAIVNVASMCGRRGIPAWSEYSASKFALCGMTEALRGEMVRYAIDVLLVLPGVTRSGLWQNLLRNTGRYQLDVNKGMPPEVVAAGILNAIRKNRTETILGWDARWILRVNRFWPSLVDALIARQIRRLYATA